MRSYFITQGAKEVGRGPKCSMGGVIGQDTFPPLECQGKHSGLFFRDFVPINTNEISLFTDFQSPERRSEQHEGLRQLKRGAIFTQAAFWTVSNLSYGIKRGDALRFSESPRDVLKVSDAQCCIARKMASRFRILLCNVFFWLFVYCF